VFDKSADFLARKLNGGWELNESFEAQDLYDNFAEVPSKEAAALTREAMEYIEKQAPTQNSASPTPPRGEPLCSPEEWAALLEQNTKDEIAAGERARAKGKMLIEAMSPEERKRLGLPGAGERTRD
jgi:hypothetical protein